MLFIVAVAIFVVMLMFVDCDLPPHPAETDTQLGRTSAARREGSFVYDVGFGGRGNAPPPPRPSRRRNVQLRRRYTSRRRGSWVFSVKGIVKGSVLKVLRIRS